MFITTRELVREHACPYSGTLLAVTGGFALFASTAAARRS